MDNPLQINALIQHIQKKIMGNTKEIKLLMTCLLAKGHVLLEDDPGSGKTALARSLSESLSLEFKRVQCTPDLLPSDLTGLNIFQPDTKTFKFLKGPIFTEILLADESNRATPRTQAALLEAMAEQQVTIDGKTRPLPPFFFVVATQNPLETQGTFPLPEAQLDRFMMQFSLDKLNISEKLVMIETFLQGGKHQGLTPLFSAEILEEMTAEVKKVTCHVDLQKYILAICDGVLTIEGVKAGISNRGILDYVKAVCAYAFLSGRNYVIPEDIKDLGVYLLAHRLYFHNPMTSTKAKEEAVKDLLERIPVPTENWRGN